MRNRGCKWSLRVCSVHVHATSTSRGSRSTLGGYYVWLKAGNTRTLMVSDITTTETFPFMCSNVQRLQIYDRFIAQDCLNICGKMKTPSFKKNFLVYVSFFYPLFVIKCLFDFPKRPHSVNYTNTHMFMIQGL